VDAWSGVDRRDYYLKDADTDTVGCSECNAGRGYSTNAKIPNRHGLASGNLTLGLPNLPYLALLGLSAQASSSVRCSGSDLPARRPRRQTDSGFVIPYRVPYRFISD
jgi:hypothetical protein